MTDNSLKVSELPTTGNVYATDRVLLLKDPSGAPSVRTIAVDNFIRGAVTANGSFAANSSHWDYPPPATLNQAIDRLAILIKALNGGTGA